MTVTASPLPTPSESAALPSTNATSSRPWLPSNALQASAGRVVKGPRQTGNFASGDADRGFGFPADYAHVRQYVGGNVADQISESVREHNLSPHDVAFRSRDGQRKGGDGVGRIAQRFGGNSVGQVGGRRSENVAAVERGADGMAPIREVGQSPDPATVRYVLWSRCADVAETGFVRAAHHGQ